MTEATSGNYNIIGNEFIEKMKHLLVASTRSRSMAEKKEKEEVNSSTYVCKKYVVVY